MTELDTAAIERLTRSLADDVARLERERDQARAERDEQSRAAAVLAGRLIDAIAERGNYRDDAQQARAERDAAVGQAEQEAAQARHDQRWGVER